MGIPEESLNRKGTTTRKCSRHYVVSRAIGGRLMGREREGEKVLSPEATAPILPPVAQANATRRIRDGCDATCAGPLCASIAEQAACPGGLREAKPG